MPSFQKDFYQQLLGITIVLISKNVLFTLYLPPVDILTRQNSLFMQDTKQLAQITLCST